MPTRLTSARWATALCILTVALAGCGRRGALEAPGSAAPPTLGRNAAARPAAPGTVSPNSVSPNSEEEDVAAAAFVSPQPSPPRRSRAFSVPNQPFILDPLL